MPPQIIIRRAKIEDSDAIARVQVDSHRSAYRGILPQSYLDHFSYEAQEHDWRDFFATEHGHFLYIGKTDRDGIVAYGLARIGPCEIEAYQAELIALHVLPSYQRNGIGRQLMSAAARDINGKGHQSLMLWVLAENSSRHFYERLGGCLIGERQIALGEGDTIVKEIAYGWPDIKSLF